MKIAISNIAWTNEQEESVAELLKNLGVKFVEIAPTKKWQDPNQASADEIAECVKFWQNQNLKIVAMQSMLFNRPDLQIFKNEKLRQETLNYLSKFIELAAKLGVKAMVFGSPKNRQRGTLGKKEAFVVAKDFFTELGKIAENNNIYFCIEPNPTDYSCDFITTAEEGIELVNAINSRGIGLHLDTACMMLSGDNISDSIKNAGDILKHFHVSTPSLGPVTSEFSSQYNEAKKALENIEYDGFVSIEMRPVENLNSVEEAVEVAKKIFD